jgi:hypothetical protein
MVIKVTQPYEQLTVQNIVMYFYGLPSMHKTTLAMTAKDALLINFDAGAHRVDTPLRRSTVMDVSSWRDIQGIQKNDLDPYATVIIDTAGTMQDCARMLVAEDKKNIYANGVMKQTAQGIANSYVSTFIKNLRSWKKDIIILAHAIEDKNNQDKTIIRPDLGGRLRQDLYRQSDCMGLLAFGNNGCRVLHFTPNDDFLAKDCANLGTYALPNFYQNATFLADLITQVKNKINTLSPQEAAQMKLLQEAALWKNQCSEARSAKDFNNLMLPIKELRVSKGKDDPQCKAMWNTLKPFAINLGFVFDNTNAVWLESA